MSERNTAGFWDVTKTEKKRNLLLYILFNGFNSSSNYLVCMLLHTIIILVIIIIIIGNVFNIHGSVHHKNILTYIQQDVTLHSLLYLETALHVSGGTTTHYQERKQMYLQHVVFVTPLLLPAAIVKELE